MPTYKLISCLTPALVFQGNIYHAPANTELPQERYNIFRVVVVEFYLWEIAHTSDLELDWAVPSWLSAGVKLQSPNKDYANWNMENNKQLGPV